MTKSSIILVVTVALLGATPVAFAQSSTSGTSGGASGSSAGGQSGASPSNPAPSGGVATGKPVIGPETPTEKEALKKMRKDTTICKGC